ncbi:MAG: acetylglutamate kinase [Acidimicrobiales bacterium]
MNRLVADDLSPALKAEVLLEALPYIHRFTGRVVVVKYGGSAMSGEPDALADFAGDIALLLAVGLRVVVVHGGGPQIGILMAKLGKESTFVDGLRVTDAETLEIVRMVLVGSVNRDLVGALNVAGAGAVGLSGEDARTISASPRAPELGFVGDITDVDPRLLEDLLDDGLVPVVATIGVDATGQAYNINADTAAGAIAEALGAEKLVYLTDVEGVRRDAGDPSTLASVLTADELDGLVGSGAVNAGMIPKAASCSRAVRSGVGQAHVLDGRVPHVLLLEIFTRAGVGTMVTSAGAPS